MRRFFYSFAFFLGGWFIISFFVDVYLTHQIRKSNSRAIAVWEDIFAKKINADLIILGSSRACDDYNPLIFDSILKLNSYNLGMQGSKIDKEIMRYNVFVNHGNRIPKYVIWDINYSTFDYSDRAYDYQFAPYLFDKDIWKTINNRQHKYTYFDKIIPLLKYYRNKEIIGYAIKNSHYWEGAIKGYLPKKNNWNPENLRLQKDYSIPCDIDGKLLGNFSNTIKEITSCGSTVFLVFSPFNIEGQRKIIGLDDLIDKYREIANFHGVFFIDFSKDSICYDTNFFADATHLNYNGADVFSNKLSLIIDSIISSQTIDSPSIKIR